MAGLDGIMNKFDPGEPLDKEIRPIQPRHVPFEFYLYDDL